MSGFVYRDGALSADDVPIPRIAAEVGTPFYLYASSVIEDRYWRFAAAVGGMNATVCYALKANPNLAVVRTFAALGAGADVVSGGELCIALAAGVPGARIVFSGVGKTRAEMAQALDAGIAQFNVESEAELHALAEVASGLGRVAPVAIRINPDVDAGTHDKISTGRRADKFGIDIDRAVAAYELARRLPGIEIAGIAVHIGSQINDVAPFRAAFSRTAELARTLIAAGYAIRRVDLGGGLGVAYENGGALDPADYGAAARAALQGFAGEVVFEPGRYLTAEAGALIARVLYVKEGGAKRFVIVDAAMNDLLRPALYGARHSIVPVAEPPPGAPLTEVDVVGPVCESGDVLGAARKLPQLSDNALIAIMSSGAYGAAMASEYNSRQLVCEVMARGGAYAVVRPRPGLESLVERDRLPPWLAAAHGTRSRGVA